MHTSRMHSQSSPRFKRPSSPVEATANRIRFLNPDVSAIVQGYQMTSEDFDVIKDSVAGRRLEPQNSLRLLPTTGWLAPLEPVTYAPWWLHLVTWVPACVVTYIWALPHTLRTWYFIVMGFVGFWPLTEYLVHRFVFHSSVAWAKCLPRPLQGCVNVLRLLCHTVHHAHPTDRLRIVTPLPMSLVIAAFVFSTILVVVPDRNGAVALLVGVVLGFVYYDYVHYDLHLGIPLEQWPAWIPAYITARVLRLRRAHRNHHYAPNGHEASFGVSSSEWDSVFGTLAKVRPLAE